MATWIDVDAADQIQEGEHRCLQAGGKSVILCRVQDKLHALSNTCPHAGLPLGDGELHGGVITCPYHGYTYRVQDGQNIDFPDHEPPVPVYPVRLHDGRVQIALDGNAQESA